MVEPGRRGTKKGVSKWLHKLFALFCLVCLAAVPARPEDASAAGNNIWLLTDSDLLDARGLALKLAAAEDPFSCYVRDYCSETTEQLLADYDGSTVPDAQFRAALLNDLNRVTEDPNLYTRSFIRNIPVSSLTGRLMSQNPQGYDRMHLNRLLLEEVYVNELASHPEQAWLLRPVEIINLTSLAAKLHDAADPVSRYLRDHCAEDLRLQLENYQPPKPLPTAFREHLVNSLNNIILQDANLYDKDRFKSVKLSPRTAGLADQNPAGAELVRLNRYLVEESYPDYITPIEPVPVDISADSLELDNAKNITIGSGHCRLSQGERLIQCDNIIVNMDSKDVLAEGNVQYEEGSDVWIGKKLRFNWMTKHGDFGVFSAFMDPFYVHAESSKKEGENEYLLKDAVLSTCEGEHPQAYFKAKLVRIKPGHSVKAWNVVMYVGGVPVMYAPYWKQNMGDPNFINMVPGYNSRMWAFLLTTFNYRISRHIEAKTHLDARARRGLAVGQDILWSESGNAKLSTEKYAGCVDDQPWSFGISSMRYSDKAEEGDTDKWAGDLITYYTYDLWPDEGESHDYPVPNERYRLRLTHNQNITDQDYIMAQFNYLSDPYIVEHFFREEYKTDPEPENYLVLGRRGQYYNLSLMFRKRLNDFYTAVDKLPEFTLDLTRQQIGESPIFYEGKHTAGYLEKLWEKNDTTNNNYSALRLDTPNTFYYPTKQFGFLNVTPRAGYDLTAYSASPDYYTNVTTTTTTGTNGVSTTSTTNVFSRSGDARLRSLPSLGVETSFKSFKVWETYPGERINNLRHIIEPYANYSFAPQPNVTSNELYQFDGVDSLGKANEIRFGAYNKLQTQRFNKLEPSSRRYSVIDLINADIWTVYRVSPDENQNVFSNISYDVRSTPLDGLEFHLDGEYNQYENTFHAVNTRMILSDTTLWRYQMEHRYLEDSNSLLNNEFSFSPYPNWASSIYVRYDFYDHDMESYGITFQRTMDCITAKIGYEWQEDDDYTFWVQLWFTQFPKVKMDVGL